VHEQLRAPEVAAGPHELGQPAIPERDVLLGPALADDAEGHRAAVDGRVLTQEGVESVGLVVVGVDVVADADEGQVEEPDHERQDLAGRQPSTQPPSCW